jgi:hypothetical protein
MTEENTAVSEQKPTETVLPKPVFSEKPVASPTSVFTPEQIAQLSPLIEQIAERKVQSVKDSRISKVEKVSKGLMDVVADLKAKGVAIPPELETQYQVESTVERMLGQRSVTAAPESGIPETQVSRTSDFNIAEELKQLELDTNNPQVLSLVSDLGNGKFRNPDHFRAEAAKLALHLSRPTESSETLATPINGKPEGKPDLMVQYKKEIEQNKGNIRKISDIQARYRKLGLQV